MALETTYTITAKKSGTIVFKFNLNGDLIHYDFKGEPFNDLQRKWFFDRFPIKEESMKLWQAIKEFTIVKGEPDLSFENFWEIYDKKAKKEVSRKLYNKLSNDDKFNAIVFIKRYKNWLRVQGTAQALPDTYLRQKRWLDEL